MNYNRTIIGGHLTRDVDIRKTPDGTSIGNVGLAVNRKWKESERVSFFEVTIFGKQAETLAEYSKKGSPILFEGRLRQDRWENEAGENRSKVKVIAERFFFAGSSPNKSEDGPDKDGDFDKPGAVPF